MNELPPDLNKDYNRVKSRKDLTVGLVLRVPWVDGALDQKVGYRHCEVVDITSTGNPVVETPNGGRLELTTLKGIFLVKSSQKGDIDGSGSSLFDSVD